jgi:uncharacterized protein (DUF433 family)
MKDITSKKTNTLIVRVSPEQNEWLELVKRKNGFSKSDILKLALREFKEKHDSGKGCLFRLPSWFEENKEIDIGTLIVRTAIRGGRPRIAGTGVTVQRIVGWYKLGLNPEEIVAEIPHLTLAQVYAALAYYHANRDKIEQDIAEEEAIAEQLEQLHSHFGVHQSLLMHRAEAELLHSKNGRK